MPGVAYRIAVFWSQLLTSQSAASAAGSVPPMTQPKNRPDGIAISPGSTSPASRSTTSAGSVGPSGSGVARPAASSSGVSLGRIGRSGSEASQDRACRAARSSAWSYASGFALTRPLCRTGEPPGAQAAGSAGSRAPSGVRG
jgi:hypothetical protein